MPQPGSRPHSRDHAASSASARRSTAIKIAHGAIPPLLFIYFQQVSAPVLLNVGPCRIETTPIGEIDEVVPCPSR